MNRKSFIALLFAGYLCTVYLVYYFESGAEGANINTFLEAVWYSLVTLTTVGYGVYHPVTGPGRMVAVTLILASVGILGFFIGKLTEHIKSITERRKMGLEGTSFSGHIIVVDWNEFSQGVLTQVLNAGKQVCLITDQKEHLDAAYSVFGHKNLFVVCADFSTPSLLKIAGVERAASLMPCFEEDTKNLVFIINAKKLFPKLTTVVTIHNIALKETFSHAGANFVISQNEVSSKIIASYVFEPIVARFSEDILASTCSDNGYDMKQYYVTENSIYNNRTFGEIFNELREQYNVLTIGIGKLQEGHHELIKLPQNNTMVEEGDYVLVMSAGIITNKLEKIFGSKEGIYIP